jgi:hypothetical protein
MSSFESYRRWSFRSQQAMDATTRRRARRSTNFRPRSEQLEERALLSHGGLQVTHPATLSAPTNIPSIVADDRAQTTTHQSATSSNSTIDPPTFMTALYERVLHRAPETSGLNFWVEHFRPAGQEIGVSVIFLTSQEYTNSHPDYTSFVDGLYRDVLQREPDASGRQFWISSLSQGSANRAQAARVFVETEASMLQKLPAPQGSVTNAAVTVGTGTGAWSGNQANIALVLNNNSAAQVSITVSGSGTYVLNENNPTTSYVQNNSNTTWSKFTFAVLSSSTGSPTIVSASNDASGQLPRVNSTKTSAVYSGGSVPTGNTNFFEPQIIFQTGSAGTVVFQQTPSV